MHTDNDRHRLPTGSTEAMDTMSPVMASGANVQVGRYNTTVEIRSEEHRHDNYTASEADLYDVADTIQRGERNHYFEFKTTARPEDLEKDGSQQDASRVMSMAQEGASCPAHQHEHQQQGRRCLHFRVYRSKGQFIQIGTKCLAVKVNILKENFNYLLNHGTLTVTEPGSSKALLNMSWQKGLKKFTSTWTLKLKDMRKKLEMTLIEGMRDMWVNSKNFSSLQTCMEKVLRQFEAEVIKMSYGCFILEFQHDSLHSVAGMLGSVDSLKASLLQLLSSVLPAGHQLIADALELSLTTCTEDGRQVDVKVLAVMTSPRPIEAPPPRTEKRDDLKQSTRLDDINRRLDDQVKVNDDLNRKCEEDLEELKAKVQQMQTMMEATFAKQLQQQQQQQQQQRQKTAMVPEQNQMHNRLSMDDMKARKEKTRQMANTNMSGPFPPQQVRIVNTVLLESNPSPQYMSQPSSASGGQSGATAGVPVSMTSTAAPSGASVQAAQGVSGVGQGGGMSQGYSSLPTQRSEPDPTPPRQQPPGPLGERGGQASPRPGYGQDAIVAVSVMPDSLPLQPGSAPTAYHPKHGAEEVVLSDGKDNQIRDRLHEWWPETGGKVGVMEGHSKVDAPDSGLGTMGPENTDPKHFSENHGSLGDENEFNLHSGSATGAGPAQSPPKRSLQTPSMASARGSPQGAGGEGTPLKTSSSSTSTLSGDGGNSTLDGTKESDQKTQQTIETLENENQEEARKYLKKIHVSVSDVLRQSVQLALGDEYPIPPRSKGVDTILCLDCSDSVAKDFETVRRAALEFVSGIEEEAELHNLEENLAVVAMGGKTGGPEGAGGQGSSPAGGTGAAVGGVGARVVQHLTNDYGRVRDAIESLVPGGRSPLFEALVVCAAAISGKGGTLTVQRCHDIRPRAVVFTDGWGTDESIQHGPDSLHNDSQLRVRVIRLVNEFCDEKHTSTPTPISWVTVGKAETNLMQSLADIGKGQVVAPSEVNKLCKYYRLQTYIGQVYKCLEQMGDKKMEQLGPIAMALIADTSPEDMDYVKNAVRQKIESGGGKRRKTEADHYDNVVDREKEGLGLLPLGTRVCRGKDWKWSDQDSNGPGTVINHRMEDLWMWVLWDSGQKNQYRYGSDGCYDLQENEEIPRVPDVNEMIAIGMLVERGSDWEGGDEDGGPGSLGTVIRRRDDGMIKVRWRKTGHIRSYKFGKSGKLELKLVDPAEVKERLAPTSIASNGSPPGQGGTTGEEERDGHPVWEWQAGEAEWLPYAEDFQEKLEKEFKAKRRMCILRREGQDFRILFKNMIERTVEGESPKPIRRQMYTDEEYELKKATMMSLQQN